MATSLDGFVARKDHSLDWLDPANETDEDLGTEAFMDSMDAMVMGRGSFETMLKLGVWPYLFPVTVLSRSMTRDDIPEGHIDKVQLSEKSPTELMRELAAHGHRRVYVDGGKIVQSFMRAGLIHEMTLTVLPILLGEGLSIFGPMGGDLVLELVSSRAFPSGIVQSTYRFPDA